MSGITSQLPALESTLSGVTGRISGRGGALAAGISASIFGASGGGGATVIHNETHVHVAGSVLAEKQLLAIVQKHSLKTNRRNPTNGLSLLPGI